MILVGSVLIILAGLVRPHSKVVFIITMFWLWIVMGFSTGMVDENSYRLMYANNGEGMELLFAATITLARKLGFSFETYKCVIYAIILILEGYVIKKNSIYPNMVLAMYMVFPAFMDVVQLRNALMLSITLLGFHFLFKKNDRINEKSFFGLSKNEIFFLICIICASFIHTVGIFGVLLLIAKKLNIRKTILFVIAINLIFGIITPDTLGKVASLFGVSDRIRVYLGAAYSSTNQLLIVGTLRRVIIFATGILLLTFFMRRTKGIKKHAELDYMVKLNIISLCIITLMVNYTAELYRVQTNISIINYILFFRINNMYRFGKNGNTIVKGDRLVLLTLLVFVSFINAYFLYYRNSYEAVVYPILNNNQFFSKIFGF